MRPRVQRQRRRPDRVPLPADVDLTERAPAAPGRRRARRRRRPDAPCHDRPPATERSTGAPTPPASSPSTGRATPQSATVTQSFTPSKLSADPNRPGGTPRRARQRSRVPRDRTSRRRSSPSRRSARRPPRGRTSAVGRRRREERPAVSCADGRADVPGRILGGDSVVVGARGEAGVRVARAGGLADPVRRRRSEAGRRASGARCSARHRRCRWTAVQLSVDRAGRRRRRQPRRRGRRRRVGRRRRRAALTSRCLHVLLDLGSR